LYWKLWYKAIFLIFQEFREGLKSTENDFLPKEILCNLEVPVNHLHQILIKIGVTVFYKKYTFIHFSCNKLISIPCKISSCSLLINSEKPMVVADHSIKNAFIHIYKTLWHTYKIILLKHFLHLYIISSEIIIISSLFSIQSRF
jgi:hypothetical protein